MFNRLETPANTVRIRFSDDDLVHYKIVTSSQHFEPLKLHHFKTIPVKPNDALQSQVPNCYLVASIHSLLEQNPQYFAERVMLIDEQFILVALHNVKAPQQIYIYQLDPTKVLSDRGNNQHRHDLIFLLEKVYAVHCYHMKKNKYYGHNFLCDYDYLLKSSTVEDALISLTGRIPQIQAWSSFEDNLCSYFFVQLHGYHFDVEVEDMIQKIFANNVDEAQYFIRAIRNMPIDHAEKYLQHNKNEAEKAKKKFSCKTFLIDYFKSEVKWDESCPEFKNNVLDKISRYVTRETQAKRLGNYNEQQHDFYQQIYAASSSGKIILLSTKK